MTIKRECLKNIEYQHIIKRFLNAYFLRPENAIFSANLATAINSNFALNNNNNKVMEVAIGDGVFSFLVFGGEFDNSFDVYSHINKLKIANHKDDIFDSYSDTYNPLIVKKPSLVIDIGYDLKESLIKKASKLNLYRELIVGNIQNINKAEKFDKVLFFSAIYHIHQPLAILKILRNMLVEGGQLFINTMSPAMTDFYSTMDKLYEDSYIKFIERGMRDLWPSLYTVSEWKLLFKDAGLTVKKVESIITKEYAPIWNIGTRPFISQNISMYNIVKKYEPEEAFIIKQEYIDRVLSFSDSFKINGGMDENDAGHFWILERAP